MNSLDNIVDEQFFGMYLAGLPGPPLRNGAKIVQNAPILEK
jgi:hypothetical protein